MNTPADPGSTGVSRARLKLVFMFLLPVIAVGLATLVYVTGIGIPKSTVNKGVLLVPPRQLDDLELRDTTTATWRYATQGAGWGILVAGGENCVQLCRERLLLARQVHRALGRAQERVKRYYLDTATTLTPDTAAYLAAEQKGLTVIHTPEPALRALLAAQPGDPDPLASGTIYLVDKRGFVMMYYLPSHPGRAMIDDLRFLLRNTPE